MLAGEPLDKTIQSSKGDIASKDALLGHLKYYLEYLHAVSPTEGGVFSQVNYLLHELDERVGCRSLTYEIDAVPRNEASEVPGFALNLKDGGDCILCKYKVPGE
ncbi:unnamed protein product [Phytophthora fragariaefolia]|uniref:Unnamed protein product n=1 Tax=Phytophthora fragariaefolia TaxID=1490495 RepID=A0A9W6YHQ2_9STRA|nr:unnamed protein product [Phytophthora fragariaefolia]